MLFRSRLAKLAEKTDNSLKQIYNEETGKIYSYRLESSDIVNVFEVTNKTDLTNLSNARLLDLAKVISEDKAYRLLSNDYSNIDNWAEASLIVNQAPPPIGFIYLQIDSTKPQDLWQGTTWEIVNELSGRYLKLSDNQSEVGQTGGSNTHQHYYEHYHIAVAGNASGKNDFLYNLYDSFSINLDYYLGGSQESYTTTRGYRTTTARYDSEDKNTTDSASSEPLYYTIVAWRRTA